MDTKFIPADHEKKLYDFWEKNGYFTAKVDSKKKPFCEILPPPNANGNLHIGHGRYTYADVMARFAKLQGKEVLWLPGADHAGFETQYTYEKYLQKEGKSRFDFNREELYQNIWDFVKTNQQNMENQLRAFGFGLDWSKAKFTLDADIVAIVYKTFKKMYDDGLIYRANRLVNYCTKNGTAFSDLEVESVQEIGILYEIAYKLADGSGEVIVATTRPETLFGDQAVMVNPKDPRYKDIIGKKLKLPLTTREITIIADEAVDSSFGTGAVKVTPAHDHTDFEVGKRHNLPELQVIGFDGKMMNTNFCDGLKVIPAREKVLAQLQEDGLLRGQKEHEQVKKTCYKCGSTLEPLPLPQWYVRVAPLTKHAVDAIQKKKVTIFPKRFTKLATRWLENAIDWNISRQIVWGIRIPAWRCDDCSEWTVTDGETPSHCISCNKTTLVQDADTFDTWFSSGQWPFATLQSLEKTNPGIFEYFYPTTVMETAYEILYFWVCRMIMLGIYVTGKVPFNTVFLHGLVRDAKGQKMSKSKGNVINPMEYIDKYGADSMRAALIFGSAEGNDIPVSEDKVRAMRNFANKIWNIGRFLMLIREEKRSSRSEISSSLSLRAEGPSRGEGRGEDGEGAEEKRRRKEEEKMLHDLEQEFSTLKKQVVKDMETYKFSHALDSLYEFIWHRYADFYIEQLKVAAQSGNIDVVKKLEEVYLECLVLLHPFTPFVTEAVWKVFGGEKNSILDSTLLL